MTLDNNDIPSQLMSIGFNHIHCQKAAINTSNMGVEAIMDWLFSHMNDPYIDAPISEKVNHDAPYSSVDQSQVDTLLTFGFDEQLVRKALKAAGGDVEKATDMIFSNVVPMDSSETSEPVHTDLLYGGRYKLIGVVSHIGTSTQCGHYLAHIYKEGRWVIFNDDKVGVSKNPPLDMGYLYYSIGADEQ